MKDLCSSQELSIQFSIILSNFQKYAKFTIIEKILKKILFCCFQKIHLFIDNPRI